MVSTDLVNHMPDLVNRMYQFIYRRIRFINRTKSNVLYKYMHDFIMLNFDTNGTPYAVRYQNLKLLTALLEYIDYVS